MTESLHPILERIPIFAGRADLAITELSGGITNRNYKIQTIEGPAYVLRIGGRDTGLLGIDRHVEYGCTLAAARVGVAPEPVAFVQPEGFIVTRFVEGAGLPAESMGAAHNIRRVVAAMQRYHGLERFPGSFSPFRVVEAYFPIAKYHQAPFPENIARLLELAQDIERALRARPVALTACHNDLLNGNFIDTGAGICILDWEYAGMGDPYFDLANFSAQHEFDAGQDEALLAEYWGAVTPARLARQQLMKMMSDLREAMWAMVQCNVAQIDFDYVSYGMKYFARVEAAARGPHFAAWLDAVAAAD